MPPKTALLLLAIAGLSSLPAVPHAAQSNSASAKQEGPHASVLWHAPVDVSDQNLFYGPGGQDHQPHGALTLFVEEDLGGSTPKFVVRDEDHVDVDREAWRAGPAGGRRDAPFVSAVGYSTDEDYYLAAAQIQGLPAHVHRGQRLIGANGMVHNIRLERKLEDRKTVGTWQWRDSPFTGTRELNGLRVLMAVIDNWDLKDSNNKIYEHRGKAADDEHVYEISDLGASFGAARLEATEHSIGNLQDYRRARFITKMTCHGCKLRHSRTAGPHRLIFNAPEYFRRLKLLWIGQHIPRADAKWMGQMLGRLLARSNSRHLPRGGIFSRGHRRLHHGRRITDCATQRALMHRDRRTRSRAWLVGSVAVCSAALCSAVPASAQQFAPGATFTMPFVEASQDAQGEISQDAPGERTEISLIVETGSHPPPLTAKQKFALATHEALDVEDYFLYGALAGLWQADNDQPTYGRTVKGYAKRYALATADGTSETFMVNAILPSLLHEDPRYYRLGHGSVWRRISHALSRTFVTRSDGGNARLNVSEIGGTAAAAGLSNLYHPPSDRTFAKAFDFWWTQLTYDTVITLLKEF